MSEYYGPALPPQKSEEIVSIGPSLPAYLQKEKSQNVSQNIIGPTVPPHFSKSEDLTNLSESTDSSNKIIGPSLPPHLREKLEQNSEQLGSEEDNDVYGPVLPGYEFKSEAHIALEERALEMKLDKYNNQSTSTVREEWMLELPSVGAERIGLGPRQFRTKTGPDFSDRSSWTNTPNSKKKEADKVNLKDKLEDEAIVKRDKQQEKLSKKHKRETDSLVDIHQKKIKKDKAEAPTERKPFNRETDLQVNRFDEAQKAAILKKAQLLDDRFSRGKSKFL